MSRRLPLRLVALTVALAAPASAFDVTIEAPGASEELVEALRAASLTEAARAEDRSDPQEVFAAARSDYGRLTGTLYGAGHYSGVINIRLDGREVAEIAPLNAPKSVGRVVISVTPGPEFKLGRADIAPLAPKTELPAGYAPGQTAKSGVLREAAEAGVNGWRAQGHAKAQVGDQSLTADHRSAVLNARIDLAPGPQARFGPLTFKGQDRMREARLQKIAGYPEGEIYDPEKLQKTSERLRRTGIFRSVAVTEAERLGPNNQLDVTATVTEMPLRRLGFGAEITSTEGALVSAYWLHRNLLGGGERLRIEAEASQIGLKGNGIDWALGLELERPASFTPDTSAILTLGLSREDEEDYVYDLFEFGFGLRHIFSDKLTARADLKYSVSRLKEDTGTERRFRNLSLPVGATWDKRDNTFDPKRGHWIDAEIMPFRGFGTTGSGIRGKFDLRGYRDLGERVVVAARLQGGFVEGSDLDDTPRDYLFWSGGGGTVRGQKFRSLGVDAGGTLVGGTRFIGGSLELRTKVTEKIGAVGFFDYGKITDQTYTAAPESNWHAGAGLGVRYTTPVGPIRLDIAVPAGGRTDDGVQFYLGIGQAF